MKFIRKFYLPIVIFLIFEFIAIFLFIFLKNLFYLFNFSYIGLLLTVGISLKSVKFKYSGIVLELAIGGYMLLYLGLYSRENMQIEGFLYNLYFGIFEAASIHYLVAKIIGPFLFGRGWCGYACWTAMILDLLPFKTPETHVRRKFGWIRYVMLILAILAVSLLIILPFKDDGTILFISFIIGNLIYYVIGILLAFKLRDNRAFCKYICPVSILMKPGSYFSILKVKVDEEKCIKCGLCERVCPMDIHVTDKSMKNKNSSECIICGKCIEICPKSALKM